VLTKLKHIFKNVRHRKKIEGKEIDVFIPHLKLGIEIDGYHWHKDKTDSDARKTAVLESKGIIIIRLREKGLRKISSNDIGYVYRKDEYELLRVIITKIMAIKTLNKDLVNKASSLSDLPPAFLYSMTPLSPCNTICNML
jgi:hypothetical protein